MCSSHTESIQLEELIENLLINSKSSIKKMNEWRKSIITQNRILTKIQNMCVRWRRKLKVEWNKFWKRKVDLWPRADLSCPLQHRRGCEDRGPRIKLRVPRIGQRQSKKHKKKTIKKSDIWSSCNAGTTVWQSFFKGKKSCTISVQKWQKDRKRINDIVTSKKRRVVRKGCWQCYTLVQHRWSTTSDYKWWKPKIIKRPSKRQTKTEDCTLETGVKILGWRR